MIADRLDEIRAHLRREGLEGLDLSPGDPLLLEAEQWIDRLERALEVAQEALVHLQNWNGPIAKQVYAAGACGKIKEIMNEEPSDDK